MTFVLLMILMFFFFYNVFGNILIGLDFWVLFDILFCFYEISIYIG